MRPFSPLSSPSSSPPVLSFPPGTASQVRQVVGLLSGRASYFSCLLLLRLLHWQWQVLGGRQPAAGACCGGGKDLPGEERGGVRREGEGRDGMGVGGDMVQSLRSLPSC